LVDWRRFMPLNRSFLLRLLKLTTELWSGYIPRRKIQFLAICCFSFSSLIMRIKSELPNKLEKRLALKLEN
jgi:hypothetical protein